MITGLSTIDRVALLRIQGSGMQGIAGTAKRLFDALAQAEINVIMISQGSSEHSICVIVASDVAAHAKAAVDEAFALEIQTRLVEHVIVEEDLAIMAVVGERMRHTTGIAGAVFQALGDYGVNIVAIAQGSSERNISMVIDRDRVEDALHAVHDRYFTTRRAPVHIFLVGTFVAGGALLRQLALRDPQATPRVVLHGILRSKQISVSPPQIAPDHWEETFAREAVQTDAGAFLEATGDLQLPHIVFVDCTASEETPQWYERLLRAACCVVTPNKRAASGPLSRCEAIRAAMRGRTKFCYETNVGAGLPVLSVLRTLRETGDVIHKIEGTLSGTLSYLFNTYDGARSFTDLLREAKEKGFTEPDPRDDLSGMDVARKLLILAREMGLPLELEEVEIENLVPEDGRAAPSVEAFFEALRRHDEAFAARHREATAQGNVLRYVASIAGGRASVRLLSVPRSHPCASLSGSDNLIAFTTARYHTQPLVVRGPGAGAEVTAAGVLSDILSCSS